MPKKRPQVCAMRGPVNKVARILGTSRHPEDGLLKIFTSVRGITGETLAPLASREQLAQVWMPRVVEQLNRSFGTRRLVVVYAVLHDNIVPELIHLDDFESNRLPDYLDWIVDRRAKEGGDGWLCWISEDGERMLALYAQHGDELQLRSYER